MKNILHVEASNFTDFPLGGSLSFSKQFNANVSGNLYLVGLGDKGEALGEWFEKDIDGKIFQYFSIGLVSDVVESYLPNRLVVYLMLRKYIRVIHSRRSFYDIVFCQTPEFVPLLSKYRWNKSIFCFAGLGNSVGNSKFKYLRLLGGVYENILFRNLKNHFDIILAAADRNSIRLKESQFGMPKDSILPFPTRFDPNIFYPKPFETSRKIIDVDLEENLIIAVGRLSHIKGWKSIIDSFRLFLIDHPTSRLIFIGDGDDRFNIESFASNDIENGSIILVGRKQPEEIATYLSAANVFVMFSYIEGWPTSMVEALACGKNIVSSNISGAEDMIIPGINGYIIENRDVKEFSYGIANALKLPNPNPESLKKALLYSSSNLDSDFNKLICNESH